MPKEDAAAVFAMLFGGYQGLSEDLLADFQATGIVHILSVSGSHISLIAAVMAWLAAALRLPRAVSAALVLSCIALYTILAGCVPPVIRSAIMAVDRGQWEAAQALGLSYTGMMRHIILPQAFKRIVPPLVSEFVTLIKDSSLISTIGAVELTQSAKVLGARYYNFILPLALACVVYLTLTLTISHFGKKIERKLAESD